MSVISEHNISNARRAVSPFAALRASFCAFRFRLILFSNENGTRYEANFSFWLTGMERGVAALRRAKGADARMEKARVDVPVEFEKSIIPKIVYESRR